jgi:hypothetical protein
MDISKYFFSEHSLSKVAAVYDNEAAAHGAALRVARLPQMRSRQVQVVRPFDRDWGRRVEPEGVGIWRTAVRAHVACTVIGLGAAFLIFLGLWAGGVTAVVTTPGMSLAALLLFGTMFGLMAGGLLTMRPDHDAVVVPVREAVSAGRWSVVVHPSSRRQLADTADALGDTGVAIFRTL